MKPYGTIANLKGFLEMISIPSKYKKDRLYKALEALYTL